MAQTETPLIPRKTLFGNPDRARPLLSPDGRQLAYLAPVDGVLNVWVGPAEAPDQARPVTRDRERGIREYFWAYTSRHILYLQDKGGDENWRVFSVDLDSGETLDLTPFDEVQARVQEVSHRFPDEILVALNNREAQLHDLHRVNIRTGARELVLENPGFIGFETDHFEVRLAQTMTPEGGVEFMKPAAGGAGKMPTPPGETADAADGAPLPHGRGSDWEWELFLSVPADDALTTGPVGFDASGAGLYLIDSRDRDTAALFRMEVTTQAKTLLAEDPRADVSEVLYHRVTRRLQAACFNYERRSWKLLDESLEPDFARLREIAEGDIHIEDQTADDRRWIVGYERTNAPFQYYLYDRERGEARFLFTNRTALQDAPLAQMRPHVIRARDGLSLVSYLTLPRSVAPAEERPPAPLPMVLLVHGGPWARDAWGYDAYHQWLANRGYAVLSVNFRGSTGLGKRFLNAANKEWGARMHEDLLDAVEWAVSAGVADPKRIAIMGGSYGGYAVLWALTNTPEVFACGVDIVGPSNLVTLLESIPPYWAPMIDMFATRVGDHRTDEGKRFLEARSPLRHVDQIRRPLLIAQGANDPRVKQAESDQIVAALQAKKIPVTYVLYPDEGHGFARPENNLSSNAITEAFLSRHLGGRCEPIGDDFAGASVQAPAGREHIPGLGEHLPAE